MYKSRGAYDFKDKFAMLGKFISFLCAQLKFDYTQLNTEILIKCLLNFKY